MSFGTTLQSVRKELQWTQPHLARRIYEVTDGAIDLTPAEISRYEKGRVRSPRLEVIRAVAKATGKPVSLFTADEEGAPVGAPFRDH